VGRWLPLLSADTGTPPTGGGTERQAAGEAGGEAARAASEIADAAAQIVRTVRDQEADTTWRQSVEGQLSRLGDQMQEVLSRVTETNRDVLQVETPPPPVVVETPPEPEADVPPPPEPSRKEQRQRVLRFGRRNRE
jgi:hypothetical protein